MSDQLAARKTLTKDSGELLAIFCKAYSRWRRATDDLEKRGEVVTYQVEGKHGDVFDREKVNPFLTIAESAEKTMISCLDRLGFTPLNREHVKPVGKDPNEKKPPEEGTVPWMLEQWAKQDAEKAGKENAN